MECIEGFDGGLPQKFTIQVDRESGTSSTSSKPSTTVYNQTSKVASFSVGNLEPGTTYDVHIYASNSKGRSETVHFRATTLNLPERRTGEFSIHEFQSNNNEEYRRINEQPTSYLASRVDLNRSDLAIVGTLLRALSATLHGPCIVELTRLSVFLLPILLYSFTLFLTLSSVSHHNLEYTSRGVSHSRSLPVLNIDHTTTTPISSISCSHKLRVPPPLRSDLREHLGLEIRLLTIQRARNERTLQHTCR